MDHTAAQSKKDTGYGDAPTSQPMGTGLKPAERRKPTGEQKKVRRQMSRQANQHTEESAAMTQHTEADLLAKMAAATSYGEQRTLAAELDALRAARTEQISAEASLDFSPITTAADARGDSLTSHLASMPPMVGGVTTGDFLPDVQVDDHDTDQMAIAMRAEANLWYSRLDPALKADSEEFAHATRYASATAGSLYGHQREAAASVFAEQVTHVHRKQAAQHNARKHYWCDKCGRTEQEGQTWGDSGKCPQCGNTSLKSQDSKPTKSSSHRWAFDEVQKPPYHQENGSSLPVGPENPDTFDEDVQWDAAAGLSDPKSEPSKSPSLGEGDTPEGDQSASIENPAAGSNDHAKDNKSTTYTDALPTGGNESGGTSSKPPYAKGGSLKTGSRPLYEIAADIRKTWPNVFFGAVPYLKAMADLNTMDDRFFEDDARTVVAYFLSNTGTWRGDDARRIKAELRAMQTTGNLRLAEDEKHRFVSGEQGSGDDYADVCQVCGEARGDVMHKSSSRHTAEDVADPKTEPSDAPSLQPGSSPEGDHSEPLVEEFLSGDYDASGGAAPATDYLDGTTTPAVTSGYLQGAAFNYDEYTKTHPLGQAPPKKPQRDADDPEEKAWLKDQVDRSTRQLEHERNKPLDQSQKDWEAKEYQHASLVPLHSLAVSVPPQASSLEPFRAALARYASIDDTFAGVPARQVVTYLLSQGHLPEHAREALERHLAGEVPEAFKEQWKKKDGDSGDGEKSDDSDDSGKPWLNEDGSRKDSRRRTAEGDGGSTCEVCGDKIAKDPSGEDPSTYHHDNGEKHDHEAKPKTGSRRTAVSLTNVGVDPSSGNGIGTNPSGDRVQFRLTDKERSDLKAVLLSDLAMNFSGVDVDESDIIKTGSRHPFAEAPASRREAGVPTESLQPGERRCDRCDGGGVAGDATCQNCGGSGVVDMHPPTWPGYIDNPRRGSRRTAADVPEGYESGVCRTCGSAIVGKGGKWIHDPRTAPSDYPESSVAGQMHAIVPREGSRRTAEDRPEHPPKWQEFWDSLPEGSSSQTRPCGCPVGEPHLGDCPGYGGGQTSDMRDPYDSYYEASRRTASALRTQADGNALPQWIKDKAPAGGKTCSRCHGKGTVDSGGTTTMCSQCSGSGKTSSLRVSAAFAQRVQAGMQTTAVDQVLYDQEKASFQRSPDWELSNIVKALNMMPFLNGPQEEARLQAVKDIQKERRGRKSSREEKAFPAPTASRRTATFYCTTHNVYVGDGNRDTHAGEGCKVEQRKSQESAARHEDEDFFDHEPPGGWCPACSGTGSAISVAGGPPCSACGGSGLN